MFGYVCYLLGYGELEADERQKHQKHLVMRQIRDSKKMRLKGAKKNKNRRRRR